MRGFELVKREDHWALYNEDGHKIAATLPGCNSKLSLKNCQAIENGYDLDELGKNYANEDSDVTNDFGKGHREGCYIGYLVGFQKALEILGDKKFSEEDIKKAFNVGWIQRHNEEGSHYEVMGKVIQSLQQTEFDVEIITEPFFSAGDNFHDKYQTRPKLDADGCLILRRL